MKTIRLKLTPRADSATKDVTFFSCPLLGGNGSEDMLEMVQQAADAQDLRIDYTIATELEYFAVRGARAWLLTEPGNVMEDHVFKVALVNGGLVADTSEIIGIIMTGEDDYIVQVVTEKECTTIDTKAGTVRTEPHVKS